MKNKKLWIFIGIVIAVLILNYIWDWSEYLTDKEERSLYIEIAI